MFELSKDHEDFRKVVREFAEDQVAPHVAQWDREHHFPADLVPTMGDLGLFGLVVPEEFGGAGRRRRLHAASASPSRSSAGSTSRSASRCRPGSAWASTRSSPTAPRSRSSAACPTSSPAARSRASASPSRTPARDAGATRTKAVLDGRRVGRRRRQGVHHQLRHRHHLGRHRHGAHRHRRRRPSRDLGHHGPVRHAGVHRRAGLRQARLAHLRHPRPDLRRAAGCPRTTCSASAAHGFRQFLKTLDDGRIAISALALGLAPGLPARRPRTTPRPARRSAGRSASTRASPSRSPTSPSRSRPRRLLTYKAAWLKDEQERGRRSVAEVKQAAAIAKLYSTEAAVIGHPDRHPGLRRQRLHGGVPGGPVLPRRQDPGDRRGHLRGAAHGHRPRPRPPGR